VSPFSVSGSEEIKHLCLVVIVFAIISYSIPFYRPTTLQHASRLDSKTFLMEFIELTIFPTYVDVFSAFFIFGWTYFRGRLFQVDHFSVDVFSVDVDNHPWKGSLMYHVTFLNCGKQVI